VILQTDRRLSQPINRYGCYYMAVMFLSNKHAGSEITIDSLLTTYDDLVANGSMSERCFITRPNDIFAAAGLRVEFKERHDPPGYELASDEIEVLLYTYPRGSGGGIWKHFVAGTGNGEVAYDPWGVSVTATKGRLNSKRVFRMVGQ